MRVVQLQTGAPRPRLNSNNSAEDIPASETLKAINAPGVVLSPVLVAIKLATQRTGPVYDVITMETGGNSTHCA